MRGSATSSANFVAPTTLAVASPFRSAFPTTRKAAVRRSGGRSAAVFLRVAIQRLPRRLGLLPAHAGRRQFHRLVDLDVSGAAAQVACQRLLDLVARRPPVRHSDLQRTLCLYGSSGNLNKAGYLAIGARNAMPRAILFDLGKERVGLGHKLIEILCLLALNDCVDTCFHGICPRRLDWGGPQR